MPAFFSEAGAAHSFKVTCRFVHITMRSYMTLNTAYIWWLSLSDNLSVSAERKMEQAKKERLDARRSVDLLQVV